MKNELINMTRAWDKEKSEFPTRIESMTSRTPGNSKQVGNRVRKSRNYRSDSFPLEI